MDDSTEECLFAVEELDDSTAMLRTLTELSPNEPFRKEIPYRNGCVYTYLAGKPNSYVLYSVCLRKIIHYWRDL